MFIQTVTVEDLKLFSHFNNLDLKMNDYSLMPYLYK